MKTISSKEFHKGNLITTKPQGKTYGLKGTTSEKAFNIWKDSERDVLGERLQKKNTRLAVASGRAIKGTRDKS